MASIKTRTGDIKIQRDDGRVVHIYQIITTDWWVVRVWERGQFGTHRTCTTSVMAEDDGWWGDLSARVLPAELEALPPRTLERSEAVGKWHAELYAEARQIIEETAGAVLKEFEPIRWDMGGGDFHCAAPRALEDMLVALVEGREAA